MNVNFPLVMIGMPDHISFQVPGTGQRQDGFKPGQNQIAIKDLTEDQAKQYAEELKTAFMDHWKEKSGG